MDDHDKRVRAIADRVRHFHTTKTPFRIYHGATNSTRVISKDVDKIVDTSSLKHVFSVDTANLTAVVEANVPMDALVNHLLPHGMIPRVVPEFPGITVGGSFSGTAAESSSFREGYFDRVVNWVEIVLADGEVVRASPSERADLFYGAAGALGTLGVVTMMEVRCLRVEGEAMVEVTYVPVSGAEDCLAKLEEMGKDESVNFLDAILFTSISGVIVQGRLSPHSTSKKPPKQRFSRPSDPWFFLHVHTKLPVHSPDSCRTCRLLTPSQRIPSTIRVESVPIRDYLFRYDRGAFWMGSYGWEALPLPFTPLSRHVLDSFFKTRTMYAIMHHSGQSQRFVVQDLAIPSRNAKAFLDFVAEELRIWPVWVCPIKGGSRAPLHSAKNVPADEGERENIINVGVWGIPHSIFHRPLYYGRRTFPSFVLLNRMIEDRVRELGGLKWLYAHNYATEDEFWASYDRERYMKLREEWGAGGLPDLFDKVGKKQHKWHSTSVFKGFWRGWLGREYLLATGKKG